MIRTKRIHDWDRFLRAQRERIRSRLRSHVSRHRRRLGRLNAEKDGDLVVQMRGRAQPSDAPERLIVESND